MTSNTIAYDANKIQERNVEYQYSLGKEKNAIEEQKRKDQKALGIANAILNPIGSLFKGAGKAMLV